MYLVFIPWSAGGIAISTWLELDNHASQVFVRRRSRLMSLASRNRQLDSYAPVVDAHLREAVVVLLFFHRRLGDRV